MLTQAEQETITTIVDLVIPPTDTPGASQIGVPEYIEAFLAHDPSQVERFRAGLGAFDEFCHHVVGRSFDRLDTDEQISILEALAGAPECAAGTFFRTLRELTIDGYYTSRVGLTIELGWRQQESPRRFTGCTHDEHLR